MGALTIHDKRVIVLFSCEMTVGMVVVWGVWGGEILGLCVSRAYGSKTKQPSSKASASEGGSLRAALCGGQTYWEAALKCSGGTRGQFSTEIEVKRLKRSREVQFLTFLHTSEIES